MDNNKKITLKVEVSRAMATMLELALQEFVLNGAKLDDGLSMNKATREELMQIANDIMKQINNAR